MSIHKVLWTGGWDSTYRVLDLVIQQKRIVEPVYLVFSHRQSTANEIQTIESITRSTIALYPEALDRVRPLKIFRVDDLQRDSQIEKAFAEVRAGRVLGGQYERLARLCLQKDLSEVELSIHRDDKAHTVLLPYVEKLPHDSNFAYRVSRRFRDFPVWKIFGRFHFPLFDITKLEMEKEARRHGFLHLLEKSWFCHLPIDDQACGRCAPCRYTVEEGMGRRLPARSRFVRYPLRKARLKTEELLPESALTELKRLKRAVFS